MGSGTENVSLSQPNLKNIYGYPKVFDWNRDGTLDLITLKQGFHLWENISGTPIPEFQYAGQLRIEEESLRQLPGSITQIDFVRLNDGWSALVGCDDWSQYWPDSASPWDNHQVPTIGLNKSYDTNGRWKGGELHGGVWMLRFCQNRSDYYLTNAQQLRTVEGNPLDVHGTATPTIVDLAADGKWHLIS